MKHFVLLPNGDRIRADSITAVRLGDAIEAKPEFHQPAHKPRVIVDFVTGEHGNCTVVDCESKKDRDKLADRIGRDLTL